MRVKPFLVLAFCWAVSLSALAPRASAQQLSKEDKIKLLIGIMRPDAGTTDQMLKQIFSMMPSRPDATPDQIAQQQKFQNGIAELIKERLAPDKLAAVYVPIYADTFSEDEIDGMLNFYQSPAGRAMIVKMPLMMPKIMQAMQAQMGDMLPEIQKIVKDSATPTN